MIFSSRIDIKGTLSLDSELHIGAGQQEILEDNKDEIREYSPLPKDREGKPIIPASTLKGVLKSELSSGFKPEADRIFGVPLDKSSNTGRVASLWIQHATLKEVGEDASSLSEKTGDHGTFHQKHVSIDPKRGGPSMNKLFDEEMVSAGAKFEFTSNWFGEEDALLDIAPVLSALANGISIGRGVRKGKGKISLDLSSLTLTRYSVDNTGRLSPEPLSSDQLLEVVSKLPAQNASANRYSLTLSASGPYLSVRTTEDNVMLPLETLSGPSLQPDSLMGALRSRARWCAARVGTKDCEIDDPSRKRSRIELEEHNLTDVERLFGVSGKQGALAITSVRCVSPGDRIQIYSNSIDRLTGGARDSALFVRHAYWQPTFEVELSIKGDHPIFEQLCESFKLEPLELGHGASIGFGWFEAKIAEQAS